MIGTCSAALATCVLVACTSSSAGVDAGVVSPVIDAATEDAPDEGADAGGDAAKGGKEAGFGEACTVGDDATCAAGLLCLEGPSSGAVGFCTKTCPKTSSAACPGAPTGTAAYCLVTDANTNGDKGCAFVCRQGTKTYSCPGDLKCQTTEEPPGSGQYLCLP